MNNAKPDWIRTKLNTGSNFDTIKSALIKRSLHTVCESAHCPNLFECWQNQSTATFMIMGNVCTRSCRFCAVSSGKPQQLDKNEPEKIAEAVAEINLDYVVITSVTRDDLADGGANHFASCITAINNANPKTKVEALIPDFNLNNESLNTVINAKPIVIAHNIETVKHLQSVVRDRRANYEQSLGVLSYVKQINPAIFTKSSIMIGIGETKKEVIETIKDLHNAGVDIVTIGQYLSPGKEYIPVKKYYTPEEFLMFEKKAREIGFSFVVSGPLVRSSYRAGELFVKYSVKHALKGESHEKSVSCI